MTLRHPLALLAAAAAIGCAYASDPIISTSFTPDPAPYVHGDTVYLFTGHDEDDAQYFKMKDWQLFSSTDMLNWTYRGTPISTATFSWAKQGDNAWAAQAVERNGKWYWYICAEDTARPGMHSIGVAVAIARRSLHRPFGKTAGPPRHSASSIPRYLSTTMARHGYSGATTDCGTPRSPTT